MKRITTEELKVILEKHEKWLANEERGERADLSRTDLSYANLNWADLRYADLSYADLSDANLNWADLKHADLNDADLSDADLIGADLSYADLRHVDLNRADLRYANLMGANLSDADLSDADLIGADLSDANLSDADLSDADLIGANLRRANLHGTIGIPPIACPILGSFIGYKKITNDSLDEYIAKLEIPQEAKRSSSTTKKCRCDKAKVLSITSLDGKEQPAESIYQSHYDSTFIYKTGSIIQVTDFNEDRWEECTTGIHFFMQKEDAIKFYF